MFYEKHRRIKSILRKTVLETWWPLLFPEKDIPSSGTVISSWESVAKKKALLSRDSMANKEDFLNAKLCFIPILLENFMQVFTHTFCCSWKCHFQQLINMIFKSNSLYKLNKRALLTLIYGKQLYFKHNTFSTKVKHCA